MMYLNFVEMFFNSTSYKKTAFELNYLPFQTYEKLDDFFCLRISNRTFLIY